MTKHALLFGAIGGLIPGISFFILHSDGHMAFGENDMLIGYAIMFVALCSIFIATAQYRKTLATDKISFGKALLLGLFITLISSIIYAASWETYLNVFDLKFGEMYQTYQENLIAQGGMSQEEAAEAINANAEMMELYDNSILVRFGFTMMEILPVGVLMSLINASVFAFILKPKQA